MQKTVFIFEQLPYVEQFHDYRNFLLKMCCSPGGSCYEQPVVAVTTVQQLSSLVHYRITIDLNI